MRWAAASKTPCKRPKAKAHGPRPATITAPTSTTITTPITTAPPVGHEIKVGAGPYYGVGGNVEATFKFNIIKLNFSFEEFEAGLGIGFGGKFAAQYYPTMRPRGSAEPEASGSYVLWDKPLGRQ